MKKFPHYRQPDAMDCGPIRRLSDKLCLGMVAKHYGKNYSLETLREKSYITREGVSLLGTSEAAESICNYLISYNLKKCKIENLTIIV